MPTLNHLLRYATALGILFVLACGERNCDGDCDTLVIVAVGEPSSLLPPLVYETVGRDISDRIFERLADLPADGSPLDPEAYTPALAERWERIDDRRWRFHLRHNVTWHDGAPFTAEDVRFSFEAFSDPTIDALALSSVQDLAVTVIDDHTVDILFPTAGPEQLYQATYHVRILPSHLWVGSDRSAWATDTATSLIVGTGPYRLVSWDRPSTVRLEASGMNGHQPSITNLVWSLHDAPDPAVNLVLSHEADVIERVPPPLVGRVEADSALEAIRYPSAVYGFLGFNLDGSGAARSTLRSRTVRRALAMALDRPALAQATIGPGTAVPLGPMSRLLWINDIAISQLPFDTIRVSQELMEGGWQMSNGAWQRRGRTLKFDILVPSTSQSRQLLAEALQESWRRSGIETTITAVDFPVFIERLQAGRFDSYIWATLDEPSTSTLAGPWVRDGWDAGNFGHYHNPVFDSLVSVVGTVFDADRAKALWVEALSILNDDAPAIFLFTPVNVAAVNSRLSEVTINPYSWLEDVSTWRIGR
ncbi:MAG: ABC transporter substrate-binding protein [Gemmatimonadales bacterium]